MMKENCSCGQQV